MFEAVRVGAVADKVRDKVRYMMRAIDDSTLVHALVREIDNTLAATELALSHPAPPASTGNPRLVPLARPAMFT